MKSINTVEVSLAGTPVGELVASRQGIYFAYHPQWVAQGFNGFYPISTDGLKRAENFKSYLATLRRILGL